MPLAYLGLGIRGRVELVVDVLRGVRARHGRRRCRECLGEPVANKPIAQLISARTFNDLLRWDKANGPGDRERRKVPRPKVSLERHP